MEQPCLEDLRSLSEGWTTTNEPWDVQHPAYHMTFISELTDFYARGQFAEMEVVSLHVTRSSDELQGGPDRSHIQRS